MRRGDGHYRPPKHLVEERLAQGVAFQAPRIFSVPHGTPVKQAQAAAAARGIVTTPRVIADPVTKLPHVVISVGHPTAQHPGVPVTTAVKAGLIHPTSQHITGPAYPGPALPAKGSAVHPPGIFPGDAMGPLVDWAKLPTKLLTSGNGAAPSSPPSSSSSAPSDGGGGDDDGGAAPPAAPPAPGGDRRGLIIAGTVVAVAVLVVPFLARGETRA